MLIRRGHKVRLRLKVKKHRFKKLTLFIMWAGMGFAVFYSLIALRSFASTAFRDAFRIFRVKSVKVELLKEQGVGFSENPDLKFKEISDIAAESIGKPWNKKAGMELVSKLKSRYPHVKNLDISRGVFNGVLEVRIAFENIVSKVRFNGDAPACLAETGRILKNFCGDMSLPAIPVDLLVNETKNNTAIHPEFAELARLIRFINANSSSFAAKPVHLTYAYPDRKCLIKLENGSVILWGGFEFARLKILRLNYVLKDLKGRLAEPYRIDLRFFREGKVLVSQRSD
ncbi:MAG: hypothetical protein HY746_06625 [Elusimicrobia bacterium]|nr:hypothetical protein [Elusimicrobiota bacterium]